MYDGAWALEGESSFCVEWNEVRVAEKEDVGEMGGCVETVDVFFEEGAGDACATMVLHDSEPVDADCCTSGVVDVYGLGGEGG